MNKVSLIIDEYNIPINITINNCKENDSYILNYQLYILQNKHQKKMFYIFFDRYQKNAKHFSNIQFYLIIIKH